MDNTIEAHGLVKRFGDTTALGGVDLAARTGTVLAVLGPNGAGKTTAVRILATCSSRTRAGLGWPATTSSPRPSRSAG
jgi:ABC-type multidrug transport system ATPase subunit